MVSPNLSKQGCFARLEAGDKKGRVGLPFLWAEGSLYRYKKEKISKKKYHYWIKKQLSSNKFSQKISNFEKIS